MARQVLRVGVILDSSSLPAWQYRLVAELDGTGVARLELVVQVRGAAPRRARGLAFRAYEALDRRLFRSPQDPMAPTDASAALGSIERLDATALRRSDGFDLSPQDLHVLRSRELDVLLQLGGGRLSGSVLDTARLGLWCFAHEEDARHGLAPLFSELLVGCPVTETRLIARSARGTTTLYRSFSSTHPNSLDRNRSGPLWKASDLPARALRGYADGREPPFGGGPSDAGEPPIARAPRAGEVARLAASIAARVAANRRRMRAADRVWFVAFRRRGALPIESDPLAGFAPVPCPSDRFHADPVLVHDGEAHYLFFEDADRRTGQGAISCRAIDSEGHVGPVHRVLEMDTHLSYPSVFAWRGGWYMIPETLERRTIELHRAVEFPLRWQLEKVLFHDVAAVDATPFVHRDRLWLFVAMSPSGASLNDELFLFHADSPGSEWIPHPMNPIVSDVRRARPAGPLFFDGDVLYRPGQDCAGDYGAAFWLNRVEVLDEHAYRETPVRRVDPSWYPGGLCSHTYTRAGAFEAMDNRVWMPRGGP